MLLPWPFARVLTALLVVLGTAVRVLPLTRGAWLLVRQPSEDGYLMLTVARNIAIGLGMSTAQGTIPTNGVQPLTAFLDVACFLLAGGDKTRGVGFVMALSVVISLVAFVAVYKLGRVVFARRADGRALAAVAAGLWFVSPIITPHSTNALETGLYFVMLAVSMRFFLAHAGDPRRDLSWGRSAILGALFGATFWARNDAIFLVAAIVVVRLAPYRQSTSVLARRVGELAVSGLVMAAVAAPWMISNAVRFGSIVPISGKAESAERLGLNLSRLPAKLAELVSVVGAIPNSLEERLPVQLACVLLLLGAVVAVIVILRRTASADMRTTCLLGLVHSTLLATFYGVFFGAGHFLSRYTSPISILGSFLAIVAVVEVVGALAKQWRFAPHAALVAMGMIAAVADVRQVRHSAEHEHFQVVDWVAANVDDNVWVGAIQTGTLGFFHDRTLNLDGKVNPNALKARFENRMRPYVLGSQIRYLVDWVGIADWGSWLKPDFEVIVVDREKNLAALKRVR